VLKADGYAVMATNPRPRAYESSAACGVKGQAAEEAVVIKPDQNSQAVAKSLVQAITPLAKDVGLKVSYHDPVVRLNGSLAALTTLHACQWG